MTDRTSTHAVRAAPLQRVLQWLDNEASANVAPAAPGSQRSIDWPRVLPFVALHLACLAAFVTGVSATAIVVAIMLYALRMFAITGFYHRYFSHRAFRTSRGVQFAFACIAASAAQRGPLWWVSHHRHHHAHADQPQDVHSSLQHGLLWSHAGWFLARENFATRSGLVTDLRRYPELRFLDRFDIVAPLVLMAILYVAGELARHFAPALAASGAQLVVWGFCISTVVLYHATFTTNSFAHRFGRRRYATRDDSRNNVWLALLTLGEGWHNNHHHYPGSARQGFWWWEIDFTYYGLRLLAALGLVWDLKEVPASALHARRYP